MIKVIVPNSEYINKNNYDCGDYFMVISDNLQKYMEIKGLNATILSKDSGVPTSRISEIVTGKTLNPQLKTLKKIASALGVTVDELTTGALPMFTEPGAVTPVTPEISTSPIVKLITAELNKMPERKLTDVLAICQDINATTTQPVNQTNPIK